MTWEHPPRVRVPPQWLGGPTLARLPFGAWNRSVYASPDPWSGYAAWMLPGLRDQVEVGTAADVAEWEGIYAERLRALTSAMEVATVSLR